MNACVAANDNTNIPKKIDTTKKKERKVPPAGLVNRIFRRLSIV